ncbi:ABC transporter permease, partial [Flavobacterium circumlabens]|uniref:ABC transporter permease n=1 Tax=Flavobacterium circumlabens TaxID=2133765 RepID=UPI0035295E99
MPEIETISFMNVWYNGDVVKFGNKKLFDKKIMVSDNGFFDIFPFEVLKGARKDILKEKFSVAISEEQADLLFRNEDPIGKSITYNNESYVVKSIYRISRPSSFEPNYVFSGIRRPESG